MNILVRRLLNCIYLVALSLPATVMSAHAAPTKLLTDDNWYLISFPIDPESSVTVEDVMGDDLPGTDDGRTWIMYKYLPNPAFPLAYGYARVSPDELIDPGRGYWILQRTGGDVVLDVPDWEDKPMAQERGCARISGCEAVPLDVVPESNPAASGIVTFNLVGHVGQTPVPRSDLRFRVSAGNCAPACPLETATDEVLFAPQMYRFDPFIGDNGDYTLVDSSDNINPWDGMWVAPAKDVIDLSPALLFPRPLPTTSLPDLSEYTLAFEDDFEGPLDPEKWNTGLLWGPYVVINNEEQLYLDSLGMHSDLSQTPFVSTSDGTLKIVAQPKDQSNPLPPMPAADDPVWDDYLEYRSDPNFDEEAINYTSGIITSYESFKFTHGYVEIRAKVPTGKGLWPAFWLLPTHYVEYVPEIDVMEFLGRNPHDVYHTYHYYDPGADEMRRTDTLETLGPDFSQDFHTFGAAWEPGQIIWYVDGIEAYRTTDSDHLISNQAMYLIANLAVGGSWALSPDATTPFPAEFEIDYIRAYKKDVAKPIDLADYELVFFDEFTGDSLNMDKWRTSHVWGPFLPINDEEQYYVDSFGVDSNAAYSPFSVANNELTITGAKVGTQSPANIATIQLPLNDPFWNDVDNSYYQASYTPQDYTSGIITSRDSFNFVHGYAEIRAKVPVGDGLWPAFWLLNSYYVGRLPEIDIMEIIGEDPSNVAHTYHHLGETGILVSQRFDTPGGSGSLGYGDGFHRFGVHWTPGELTWYVDGVPVHTLTDPNVAYQLMYVIANLAIGGAFNMQPVDDSKLPAELVIDYIRIYQEKQTG